MAPFAAPPMAFQLLNFFEPWLSSTSERRHQFLQDPRLAMEEIVGVPSDSRVVVENGHNQIWFQASIPKLPDATDGSTSLLVMRQRNDRINLCPILRVSGREFIANHVQILAEYGIRVPEDVIVIIDAAPKGYLHSRVRLDTLYPVKNETATPTLE